MHLSAAFCLPMLAVMVLTSCSTFAQAPVSIDVPAPTTSAVAEPSVMGSPQRLPNTKKLVVGKRTILLEEANTQQEQAMGLMFRRSMPLDQGMLFNFTPARPAQFWMKNTLIPLDIIFLHDGVIKNIQANVPPCQADPCRSYGPDQSVNIDQVLELNAGQASILGFQEGSRLQFLPLVPSGVAQPTAAVPTPRR